MSNQIGGTYKKFPSDFKVIEDSYDLVPNSEGYFIGVKIKCTKWEKLHLRSVISKRLKVPIPSIVFAGLKDKHAITTQVITIRTDLENCKLIEEIPNLEVLEMVPIANPLRIGVLHGNYFEITIRDTNVTNAVLENSLFSVIREIEENGIVNIFGEQRMGKAAANYLIGECLKSKAYTTALELIIQTTLGIEEEEFRASTSENLLEILKKTFPNYVHRAYECYLETLDAKKAIYSMLPKSIIRLYHSAFESHRFNQRVGDSSVKRYYAPFNEKMNPLLLEKVEITRKNGELFEARLRNREGVLLFRVGKMSYRPYKFYPQDLKLLGIDEDTYTLSFYLPKGCYATEVIKKFINAPVV